MQKLGVMVRDLGQSQLNYFLIRGANAAMAEDPRLSVTAFYEVLSPPCLPLNFASMQFADGYGFDGPMVATTLSAAAKLIDFPSACKKLFYVWDFEWGVGRPTPFREKQAIYGHRDLTVVCRSHEHADAFGKLWNRPAAVAENFDFDRILELIR